MAEFLTDIQTLRDRARAKIEEGPITKAYGEGSGGSGAERGTRHRDRRYLRYKRHYFMARGIIAEAAANEFLQHATEEPGHADQIACASPVAGAPNFSPDGITSRSHAEYVAGDTLTDMIGRLVAERIAIESYSEIIRWLDDNDSTTRNLMETILAVEEEHANDMLGLQDLGQKS